MTTLPFVVRIRITGIICNGKSGAAGLDLGLDVNMKMEPTYIEIDL